MWPICLVIVSAFKFSLLNSEASFYKSYFETPSILKQTPTRVKFDGSLTNLLVFASDQHSKNLLAHLFNSERDNAYTSVELPMQNISRPIRLSSSFYLNQIIKLVEKSEVLETIIWVENKWTDYSLTWNPDDFGGIMALNLPHTDVWKPDIMLMNCASGDFGKFHETNVIVSYDGSIIWYPLGLFTSTCAVDITWFPFDEQTCYIKFGLWTHPESRVSYRLTCTNQSDANCEDYAQLQTPKNGEFNVLNAYAQRSVEENEFYPNEKFNRIILSINFQRRALFYIFNLLFPCLILSIVTIFVFVLPPDAGGKISFGITILLSQSVFLQTVSDILPQDSFQFPVLVSYFLVTMLLCVLSISATVLVMSFNFNDEDPVFTWVQTYINGYLARLVFLTPPPQRQHNSSSGEIFHGDDEGSESIPSSSTISEKINRKDPLNNRLMSLLNHYRKDLFRLRKRSKVISSKVREIEQVTTVSNEWRFAGRVVDRFCLIIYTLSTFLMTIGITLAAPNLSRSLA